MTRLTTPFLGPIFGFGVAGVRARFLVAGARRLGGGAGLTSANCRPPAGSWSSTVELPSSPCSCRARTRRPLTGSLTPQLPSKKNCRPSSSFTIPRPASGLNHKMVPTLNPLLTWDSPPLPKEHDRSYLLTSVGRLMDRLNRQSQIVSWNGSSLLYPRRWCECWVPSVEPVGGIQFDGLLTRHTTVSPLGSRGQRTREMRNEGLPGIEGPPEALLAWLGGAGVTGCSFPASSSAIQGW